MKFKISTTQQLRIATLEVFSIVMTLTFSVLLLVVTLQAKQSKSQENISFVQVSRTSFCSTDIHVQVQFLYVTVLSLSTGIQGFRARRLPAAFKDTHVLTYASFLSVLIFGVSSGIYFSQQDPYIRTVIIAVHVLCLVDMNFILLFAYKIYVMLFRAELNDSTIINKQIRDKTFKKSVRRTNWRMSLIEH